MRLYKKRFYESIILLTLLINLSSCAFYKQDLPFQVKSEEDEKMLVNEFSEVQPNQQIKIGDQISYQVWTHNGELIIDPDRKLLIEIFSAGTGAGGNRMMQGNFMQQGGMGQNQSGPSLNNYVVRADGTADFPMIGFVKVAGLNLWQLDSLLQDEYELFYSEPFVKTIITNRRVFLIIGNNYSKVELMNDPTTLFEVFSKEGGVEKFSDVSNIKIIRGSLENPEVKEISIRYLSDLKNNDFIVQPNDIIYVTPGRRPIFDGLRDISAFLGLTSSILTFLLFITTVDL